MFKDDSVPVLIIFSTLILPFIKVFFIFWGITCQKIVDIIEKAGLGIEIQVQFL